MQDNRGGKNLNRYWKQYHSDDIGDCLRHDRTKRWVEAHIGYAHPADPTNWRTEDLARHKRLYKKHEKTENR